MNVIYLDTTTHVYPGSNKAKVISTAIVEGPINSTRIIHEEGCEYIFPADPMADTKSSVLDSLTICGKRVAIFLDKITAVEYVEVYITESVIENSSDQTWKYREFFHVRPGCVAIANSNIECEFNGAIADAFHSVHILLDGTVDTLYKGNK